MVFYKVASEKMLFFFDRKISFFQQIPKEVDHHF